MTPPGPCICITGPTACGKTELALQLADALPLEIINMDSAIVYRGMDIGTAKPPAEVRCRVPHHLVDVLDPTEPYSAGRFARDARKAIEEILARGRLPLLVGGTLLYLRALREGLADLPEADEEIRRRLDELAEREGWPALHRRLGAVDPAAARRIAATDRQRIQRALEVYELAGESLSSLQARPRRARRVPVRVFALDSADRSELARRIERRFDAMVAAGFVGEVETLRARGDLTAATPAMRAVGYRQIWAYLDGRYDWAEARQRALAATRQLAKRQMTWLRADSHLEIPPMPRRSALALVLERLGAGGERSQKRP